MDITKEEDVVAAVAKAIDSCGRIDILVNNSGIGGPTCYLWDLSLADWNEIIAVDLTGSMLCAREVLKHMVPAGGAASSSTSAPREDARAMAAADTPCGPATAAPRWG